MQAGILLRAGGRAGRAHTGGPPWGWGPPVSSSRAVGLQWAQPRVSQAPVTPGALAPLDLVLGLPSGGGECPWCSERLPRAQA